MTNWHLIPSDADDRPGDIVTEKVPNAGLLNITINSNSTSISQKENGSQSYKHYYIGGALLL